MTPIPPKINTIADWPQLLTLIPDPSTQYCVLPYTGSPYVAEPTMVDTTGATIQLNPRDWATLSFAQWLAAQLGGYVTSVPPAWFVPPWGVKYGQTHYWIVLAGPATNNPLTALPFGAVQNYTTDPATIANMFPMAKANLEVWLPQALGITWNAPAPPPAGT